MANMPIGQKDRPWRARIIFQNGEASSAFEVGNAAVLLSTNTAKVIKPSTAGAAVTPALFAGVATKAAAAGEFFEVIVAGFAPTVGIIRMTRAAVTDAWASFPAIAVGDFLTIDTVNNKFMRGGAGASAAYGYQVVALESLASATTLGSGVSTAGGTVISTTIACWLRALV